MKLDGFHPELRNYASTREQQLYLRKSLPPDCLAVGLADAAKLAAEMAAAGDWPSPHKPQKTQTPKTPKQKEVIPPKRPKITQHVERSFTFSSGETKRCCTADGCLWGTPTARSWVKKHLDGAVAEVEAEEREVEQEISPDDPVELSLEVPIPIAGDESETDIETHTESQNDEQLNEPQDAEPAESFGRGGLVAECE